jgi:phospholipid transport system transporter-binding protein
LQDFDSSTVALLLEARRRAQGGAFVVRNAPPKLRELAKLYGVEELLSFDETT